MPTHITYCVVCNEQVACCDDEHGLGVGGSHGEGGCENPPYIEFCSLDHAEELQRRLAAEIERWRTRMEAENGENWREYINKPRRTKHAPNIPQ